MKWKDFFKLALVPAAIMTIGLFGCAPSSHNSLAAREIKNPLQARLVKGEISNHRSLLDEAVPDKKLPPATAGELERMGDGYMKNGNQYMAFVQYERSLQLNPDNVRVRYKTGLLFLLTKKYEDAEKTFQEVLKKKPGYALAHLGLGEVSFHLKQYGKAEKNLQKAVELEPKLWKARNLLGVIHDYRREYDKAFREYSAAILLRPDNGLLYNNLGVSLSLAGRYDEAIRAFKKALGTKCPKEKVYNNLGLVFARTGEYAGALQAFSQGTDRARAHNNLGCVYLAEGKTEKAAQCFHKAIEINPTFYVKADENLKKVGVADFN